MTYLKPNVGDFFPVGLDTIYVVEVGEGLDNWDKAVTIIGHDNDGNEVEVTAYFLEADEYDAEYGTDYSGQGEDALAHDPWPYKHQDL